MRAVTVTVPVTVVVVVIASDDRQTINQSINQSVTSASRSSGRGLDVPNPKPFIGSRFTTRPFHHHNIIIHETTYRRVF